MVRSVCLAVLVFAAAAFSQSLQIRDVRGWGSWGAHITSLDYQSTVDGVVSRNVLTMTIRDTLSQTYSDSLEVTLNFNLPRYSVVDSMYLWINGVPVSAYLKEYANAVAIYESIVKRRKDPALLRKNGTTDNYTLQVFPYARRQTRKVRICYTTPLSIVNQKLSTQVPLEILASSLFPAETITATVNVRYLKASSITLVNSYTGEAVKQQYSSFSSLFFSDRNQAYSSPLTILLNDPYFAQSGVLFNCSQDAGGDLSFISVVDPENLFNITPATGNAVLFIWNTVAQSYTYDYTQGRYVPNSQYNYSTSYEDDKAQISSLIRNNLRSTDRVNVWVNDGDISSFSTAFSPVTSSSADNVQAFLNRSIKTRPITAGCADPANLLLNGLASIGGASNVSVIVIDKSYNYWYGPVDSAKFTSDFAKVKSPLPATAKTFGIFGSAYYQSALTLLYRNTISCRGGLLYTANASVSLAESLKNVPPYLSGKF